MKKLTINLFSALTLLFLSASTLPAFAQNGGTDLFNLALETKAQIATRLAACGTNSYHPRDPRLPPPRVPAHEAYANLERSWLAGYFYRDNSVWMVQNLIYNRPNGGSFAWMTVSADQDLGFYTAAGGLQARIMKAIQPGGESFRFICRNTYVNELQLRECVENLFVQPILHGFCL